MVSHVTNWTCPLSCSKSGWAGIDRHALAGFSDPDYNTRQEAFLNFQAMMRGWSNGDIPPTHNGTGTHSFNGNGHIKNGVSITNSELDKVELARMFIPSLFRLSVQCPLPDVRTNCEQLLASAQSICEMNGREDMGIELDRRGASFFIPQSQLIPVDTIDNETKELFREAFLQNTRLDHLTQVMGFHPQYLACFLKAQDTLMRDDGPLPLIHRQYIAIIAAARHQCTYLTHIHTNEYLQLGGDSSWLESLDNVPTKLRNLQEINRLLAHRPWLVTRAHIESLCRCGSNSWSLSELTQAIVLLTHFHSLCSAVFGCGINFELDDGAGRLFHSDGESNSDSDSDSTSVEPVENLLERLRKLNTNESEEGSLLEPKVYDDIATQTAELQGKDKRISDLTTTRVIDHPEFTHADFVKRMDKTIQTFRATDYSWETHGFSICNRFYSDVAQTLDERFRIAQDMTYYTIGDKYTNVNTQEFRTAVWNYIHCIMGIKHDDYNYKRVNHLLERGFKSFIKLITCHPERVNKKDFDCIMKGFTYSEKIHVAIILMEARMQAELLYGLRAVAQFMT